MAARAMSGWHGNKERKICNLFHCEASLLIAWGWVVVAWMALVIFTGKMTALFYSMYINLILCTI